MMGFHHSEEQNNGNNYAMLTSQPSLSPAPPLRTCLGITGLYLMPITLIGPEPATLVGQHAWIKKKIERERGKMLNSELCLHCRFWMDNENSRSFFLRQFPFHSQKQFQHVHLGITVYEPTAHAFQKQAERSKKAATLIHQCQAEKLNSLMSWFIILL